MATIDVPSYVTQARTIRQNARDGILTTSTSGLVTTMQTNLIVLPSRYAADFRDLCLRNPVPCPLLEILPASTFTSRLAAESDVRTDLPAYNIYHNNTLYSTVSDVMNDWTSDHVGFLIGCSYSFEIALAENGLPPRSMLESKAVPMFTTNIPLNPAGVFTGGNYVVSMRSYKAEDVERVRKITSRFLKQHGEPIAWGWDGAHRLGVKEKLKAGIVDFGDVVMVPEGEVPIFWGCGVTPQVAVTSSNLEGVFLGHKPGSMFVTDIPPDDESFLTMALLELQETVQ